VLIAIMENKLSFSFFQVESF